MKLKKFKGAVIIDGNGGKPIVNGEMLVKGDTIIAVGNSGEISCEEDFEEIDVKGKTIMPGMINCHVHLLCDPGLSNPIFRMVDESQAYTTMRAINQLKALLKSGVTYCRDMGGTHYINIDLKDAVLEGLVEGPNILTCGKPVIMTGGHGWFFGRECDGPDEARKGAREQIKAGADFIKVMSTGGYCTPGVHPKAPQMTIEEMAAAIEVAHYSGKPTATHCNGVLGMTNAVKAGVDCIDHGEIFAGEDEKQVSELFDTMAKKGVFLVPTLITWFSWSEDYDKTWGYKNDISTEFLNKPFPRSNPATKNPRPWRQEYFTVNEVLDGTKKALKAGVKIAVGNDSGLDFVGHDSWPFELKALMAAGMSTMDALVAATKTGAEVLDIDDKYGTLEPNKQADFLILKDNPIENINTLFDIEAVYKNGTRCKFE